jgi:YVTN family beta-propeller protein
MNPVFLTESKNITAAVILSSLLIMFAIDSVAGTAAFAETVVTYINTPAGEASFIAVNPSTNKIYASTGSDSVTVIDGATNKVISTLSIPIGNGAIAVNPNTNRIYVGSSSDAITVIDGSSDVVIATISLNYSSPTVAWNLAVNPGTNKVYVDNYNFQTGNTPISIIDGSSNSVIGSITQAPHCGLDGMVVNPVKNILYGVDCPTVDVWNLGTNVLAATIRINNVGPWGIDVNPNTNTVYVGERGFDVEKNVVVIDGSTNTIVTQINTGVDSA